MDCKLERVRNLVWKRRHYVLTVAGCCNDGEKRIETLWREQVKCLDTVLRIVQLVDVEFC